MPYLLKTTLGLTCSLHTIDYIDSREDVNKAYGFVSAAGLNQYDDG